MGACAEASLCTLCGGRPCKQEHAGLLGRSPGSMQASWGHAGQPGFGPLAHLGPAPLPLACVAHQPHARLLICSYTTIISQCGTHQQLRRALELVGEMRARGIEANIHTYSALMSVCVKCNECDLALDVYQQVERRRLCVCVCEREGKKEAHDGLRTADPVSREWLAACGWRPWADDLARPGRLP